MKTEVTRPAFTVAAAVKCQVVRRAEGDWLGVVGVHEAHVPVHQGRRERPIQERIYGIPSQPPGDRVSGQRGCQQQCGGDATSERRSGAEALPLTANFNCRYGQGSRNIRRAANLSRQCRPAQYGSGIQIAPLARVAKSPDRRGHSHNHGGQEILYEQRASDELHERATSKQG